MSSRKNQEQELYRTLVLRSMDFLLLRKLNEVPTHGYGFMDHLKITFGVEVGPGTFYPRIHRLGEEGLISCSEVAPGSGGFKKIYKITERGKEKLEQYEEEMKKFLVPVA